MKNRFFIDIFTGKLLAMFVFTQNLINKNMYLFSISKHKVVFLVSLHDLKIAILYTA